MPFKQAYWFDNDSFQISFQFYTNFNFLLSPFILTSGHHTRLGLSNLLHRSEACFITSGLQRLNYSVGIYEAEIPMNLLGEICVTCCDHSSRTKLHTQRCLKSVCR
jgi:hypothetical protein